MGVEVAGRQPGRVACARWGRWVGWVARACGVAGALHGSERIAQVVELLFCSGKLVGGGFECP